MAKRSVWYFFYLTVLVSATTLASMACANTDPLDVMALQDLYRSLNNPSQLKGWKLDGGDPCEESWTGVLCSGSSVIYLKLIGLNLSGYLGIQLNNLHNLKQLDVSSNNILGEIPNELPPNATILNFACNNLSLSIPSSLPSMKYLRHLNLSHNFLSGIVGNVFTDLHNLKEMDLSYNNFVGDLPSSFASLTNLTGLFLQNNKFTGSVIFLADLPLTDLNIQDNHFSGIIPNHFQSIANLWMGGNKFHVGTDSAPWQFPLLTVPINQNITDPRTTQSSAIENHPSLRLNHDKKRRLGPGGIVFMVGGGTLVTCAALFIAIYIKSFRKQDLSRLESNDGSVHSLPISTARDYSCALPEDTSQILVDRSSPVLPPVCNNVSRRRSFTKHRRVPRNVKYYTVAELQLATNSFSENHFIGEGSLGSVYKAEFPDGKIMAIKNINLVTLNFHEEEQFLDVIRIVSRLRHPNIVKLFGYCVEHEQHLLVYEFITNFSLHNALHSEVYEPLSWCIRLRIALGVARALDYLHSTFSPPVAHSNMKAANILLDEDFMPRICDCGLTILRPLTTNRVKVKASEIAIGDAGYIAPEHGHPGIDNRKSDIYAYGVLLLELLTGRLPFDSSRPREEQSLVKWASSRLHDSESLEDMVDPRIKKTLSSKTLSNFADIVSLCIQPEKEFRPPMSGIVDSLTCLLNNPSKVKSVLSDCTDTEPFKRSFCSTNSHFLGSPAISYASY